MYYYVSAWNKLSKTADIFTASWAFHRMAGPSSPAHLDFRKVPVCGNFLGGVKAHSQGFGMSLVLVVKCEGLRSMCQDWFPLDHANVLCYSIIQFFKIIFEDDFPLLSHSGQSTRHLVLSFTWSFLLFWDFPMCSSGWILACVSKKVKTMKADSLEKVYVKMYKFKNLLLLNVSWMVVDFQAIKASK